MFHKSASLDDSASVEKKKKKKGKKSSTLKVCVPWRGKGCVSVWDSSVKISISTVCVND